MLICSLLKGERALQASLLSGAV